MLSYIIFEGKASIKISAVDTDNRGYFCRISVFDENVYIIKFMHEIMQIFWRKKTCSYIIYIKNFSVCMEGKSDLKNMFGLYLKKYWTSERCSVNINDVAANATEK